MHESCNTPNAKTYLTFQTHAGENPLLSWWSPAPVYEPTGRAQKMHFRTKSPKPTIERSILCTRMDLPSTKKRGSGPTPNTAPVPDRARSNSLLAGTCKAALSIFVDWSAHTEFVETKLELAQVREELALFGTTVGCVTYPCSVCNEVSINCKCRVWTCRCENCKKMRLVYQKTLSEGQLSHFRMISNDIV